MEKISEIESEMTFFFQKVLQDIEKDRCYSTYSNYEAKLKIAA